MKPLLFAFPEDHAFAALLAPQVAGDLVGLNLHRFPDGEVLVRLDGVCAERPVVIVCGGHAPNESALPLYFAASTARELGASSVGLLAPYLPYMRQDTRFHAGEAVSARIYASFISHAFDWLVTVDPHLHRFASLESIYRIPTTCVSSTTALAGWIAAKVQNPIIVGPDRESEQWAAALAAQLKAPVVVLEKTRRGDRDVSVSAPARSVLEGRTPVVVDDIVSSGHTLARVIEALIRGGARQPVCAIVHALFSSDAEMVIRSAGVVRIVSTNTIAHESNAIDLTPAVSAAVSQQIARVGKIPR